jgi:hypothetical protein
MKNDMKLIMESWRSSDVMVEADDSIDFVRSINPVEFPDDSIGTFLLDVTKVMTNGKTFADVAKNTIRKLDDQVDDVKDRKVNKAAKKGLMWAFTRSIGLGIGILTTPFTGGAGLVAGTLGAEVIGTVIEKVLDAVMAKVESANAVLNIPDDQRSGFKSADAWDVNDDLIRIIAGADKDFSRSEFVPIATVYIEIGEAIKKVLGEVRSRYEAGQSGTIKQYLQEPLSNVLSFDEGSANAAAQAGYAKTVELSADYTIKK